MNDDFKIYRLIGSDKKTPDILRLPCVFKVATIANDQYFLAEKCHFQVSHVRVVKTDVHLAFF